MKKKKIKQNKKYIVKEINTHTQTHKHTIHSTNYNILMFKKKLLLCIKLQITTTATNTKPK